MRQQVSRLTTALENESINNGKVSAPAPTTSTSEVSAVPSFSTSSHSRLQGEDSASVTDRVQPTSTTTVPLQTKKSGGSSTSASSLFNKTTSRLVSSLRPSSVSGRLVRTYSSHRDGVWDVTAVHRNGTLIVASASADYAVRIFNVDCQRPVVAYSGHRGSANSVRFYPSPNRDLVLSAAGDSTVHLWEFPVSNVVADAHKVPNSTTGAASSDDFELSDEEQQSNGAPFDASTTANDPSLAAASVVRIPRQSYMGHQGAVVAADFLLGGQHIVSGGWDRLAHVFSTETGQLLATLSGHDAELTSVAGHPSPGRPMVLTASKDASFRMWDLRDRTPQLVAAVQGHSGAVNAAVFAPGDRIVSGGDDRAVRIWDLRQLSSPLAVAKPGSAVNRLSVHWTAGVIGAPCDNSHVYIYDATNCNKLGRLPRRSGGHRRIVSAVCWVEQQHPSTNSSTPYPNFFTAGFDHRLIGWNVSISGPGRNAAV